MPTRLQFCCRTLLIIVLVTPNFYSAVLAGRFGCFSCLSTLSPDSCQDTCWFVPKWSLISTIHLLITDELCLLIYSKTMSQEIPALSYFCINWLFNRPLLIFACLYPTFGKVGYKNLFPLAPFCAPTLKSWRRPWLDLHFSLQSTCNYPQLSWAPAKSGPVYILTKYGEETLDVFWITTW